nr:crosslink repair DNA glycosylase YcaQ family protein [Nocardioides massiliensis]
MEPARGRLRPPRPARRTRRAPPGRARRDGAPGCRHRPLSRRDGAVAGSRGRDKLWDLAERVYAVSPEDAVPYAEALRERGRRRLASLGIARAKGQKMPLEPVDVGAVGEPAVVDGVPGEWRIAPALLDTSFEPRAALLSPFDRLVYDRKRVLELFGFDYTLEMYKPAAKRRWGYYALPVLYGDRLIGKLDARADRDRGVLVVNALHEDGAWSPRERTAVQDEIAALAHWLGLRVAEPD